jgi:hypothetical protein
MAPGTHPWKSWRESQIDEIIGLPEKVRGSAATGFCNAFFALNALPNA